jgi:hypothetical protein
MQVFLSDALVIKHNVIDNSISHTNKKWDFLLEVYNNVLVIGEDKSDINSLPVAISELSSKHKGNTRATYGDLDHILAFATAHEQIQFFRMSLVEGTAPVPISPVYRVSVNRDLIIKAFINVIRWAHATKGFVSVAQPMHIPIYRDSPFDVPNKTTIVLHHKYVEKTFFVPASEQSTFIAVYTALKALNNQDCRSVKIQSLSITLTDYIKYDEQWTIVNFSVPPRMKNKDMLVQLRISPIGAR